MKVLIVQNYNPINNTGIPIANMRVAKVLQKMGSEVTIAAPVGKTRTTVDGISLKLIETIAELRKLIEKNDAIIPITNFSSQNKPLSTGVITLCKELNKDCFPYVRTTFANSQFNEMNGVCDLHQELYIKQLSEALKQKCVKKVLCISNSVAKSIEKLGINSKKLTIVNNGIDPSLEIFNEGALGVKKEFDVAFVGRMSREKGLPYFLGAIKLVTKSKADLKVALVGGGDDLGRIKGLIKSFDLEKNIDVLDSIENGRVLEIVKVSKCFVSTSITESFGIAILEAMALGVPVIVPNIEGPLELTDNGKLGTIFEQTDTNALKEAIVNVIEGNVKAFTKAKKARKTALTKYTNKEQAEKIYKVIAKELS